MATHPSYNKEDRRLYQRAYRAAGNDLTYTDIRSRAFVGVDGEGGNLESGYHAYFLLSAGERRIVPDGGNARLSTRECLRFLDELPRDAIYVVYFGDYDVTKILEDMSWAQLERLIDRSLRKREDGRGWWPVDFGDYQVDYLPRKEFKVRRIKGTYVDPDTGKRRREYTPWLVINDVGPFFQCRFVEALTKWGIGTPEEREAIGIGKEARDRFDYSAIDDISTYNQLEIKLLQELMEKFREACYRVGYVPSKWQGPGQLAEAMLSKHGVARSKDVSLLQDENMQELLQYGLNAFYGGRPEISVVGPVDREVTQYDINSAYPYAMQFVPCLLHGGWSVEDYPSSVLPEDVRYTEDFRHSNMSLMYGSFTSLRSNDGTKYPRWYGLPIRRKEGSIAYPGAGRGWYWSFEIAAAIHQQFRVERAWRYQRQCDCRPLAFVADVYQLRKTLGKDDAGTVLKLGLNSLYGKQVQSVGSPRYANPIWGSFITAVCRTMIQQFIHASAYCSDPTLNCGLDVLMVATDSVCTWNPRLEVKESGELGGWSRERHPRGMFIVQPGLYFGSSSKPAKTRGVPRSVIEHYEPRFRDAFNRMVSSHKLNSGDVDVPQRMFVGIRYALHRRNLKLLGQWIEFEDSETGRTGKRISFDWSSKRMPFPALDPIPGVRSYIETFPQAGDVNEESLPYSKDIGGLVLRTSLRALFDGQPDWSSQIEPGDLSV